jgi:putative membrane protein
LIVHFLHRLSSIHQQEMSILRVGMSFARWTRLVPTPAGKALPAPIKGESLMRISRLKSPVLSALFGVLGAAMLLNSLAVHPQDKSDQPSATQSKESSSGASSGASTKESGATTKLSSSEENLVKQLAEANMAEINAGKLAQNKAQNDEVKSFAKKMVDDHTKSLEDLKQLAQSKGVMLPIEPNKQQMAMEQKLQGLSGERFDRQYMKQGGERAQRQTHQLLQKAEKAEDADLKNYATKTIAAVEGHQKMARETERSLKGGATGKSGGGTTGAGEESSGKSGHGKTKGGQEKPKSSGSSATGTEGMGGGDTSSGTYGGSSK